MGIAQMNLVILSLVIASAVLQNSEARNSTTTHVVGGNLGWVVPPGGPLFYATWALHENTFLVGDILLFNFTIGQQNVARVTEEAFLACNSANSIDLKTSGPASFTLDSVGLYYFISTMKKHCIMGQGLIVNVTSYSEHTQAPAPAGPKNHTVGGSLGWIIPPGGPFTYIAWAYHKNFVVGDTLVFNFYNGSDDVAQVAKEVYEFCNVTSSSTLAVYDFTPAFVYLKTEGEYYFTSRYKNHCLLGQKLAINVTGTATSPSGAPSIAVSPDSANAPIAPSPSKSRPARVFAGYFFTFSMVIMTCFY